MIWLVTLSFALIAVIDLIPLIKRKKPHAIAAFICCFAVALTIGVLTAIDIKVPSAMKGWQALYDWIGIGYKP